MNVCIYISLFLKNNFHVICIGAGRCVGRGCQMLKLTSGNLQNGLNQWNYLLFLIMISLLQSLHYHFHLFSSSIFFQISVWGTFRKPSSRTYHPLKQINMYAFAFDQSSTISKKVSGFFLTVKQQNKIGLQVAIMGLWDTATGVSASQLPNAWIIITWPQGFWDSWNIED